MSYAPLPGPPSAGLTSLRGEGGLTRLLRRPSAVFGLIVIILVAATALAAPLATPYDPDEQFFDGLTLEGAPLPPNAHYWLGTDLLGRDLLSRLIYGARTSLIIGIVANGIARADRRAGRHRRRLLPRLDRRRR